MRATKTSKNILDKSFSLIDNEKKFKRACEQILQLNQRMDELQFRYTKAKQANHRSFRYNLRLRLAVIEGLRNMYYDYAHHKAEAVAELRRELFGEEVEIVTDGMSDSEMEDWTENLQNGSFQSHTYFSKRSYKAEKHTINFLPTIRLPCILIWNNLMRVPNFLCSKFRVISRFHVLFTIIDKISDNSFEGCHARSLAKSSSVQHHKLHWSAPY